MANFDKETKKHLLGEFGVGIVQEFLLGNKKVSCIPWNVIDPRCDLIVLPDYPDITKQIPIQIKTKAPWVVHQAQSFTVKQWAEYQHIKNLIIICAPVPDQYADRDIWKGNMYWINPQNTVAIPQTTKDGRDMMIIPLKNLEPCHVIKEPEKLKLMKRFITEKD